MNQIQIGNYIAKKRKEKNMTQARLAEVLGVSNKTISKWETGKCMPDYSVMGPLCSVLEITLPELMDGEDIADSTGKTYDNEQILELLQRIETVMNQNKVWNQAGIPWQRILAVVMLLIGAVLLLLFQALGARLIGFFGAGALLGVGLVLFLREKDVKLRIGWLLLLLVELYLRIRYGAEWMMVLATPLWNASMNYLILARIWLQFLLIVAMVIIGVEYWKRNGGELPRWKYGLFLEGAIVVGVSVLLFIVEQQDIRIAAVNALGITRYRMVYSVLDWLRILAFTNGLGRWFTRKERKCL